MDTQNTINELCEMNVLHDTYNKHKFEIEIPSKYYTYKMCKCGKLNMSENIGIGIILIDEYMINEINKHFNLLEIDLIKHIIKINPDADITDKILFKLNKDDAFEIFKLQINKPNSFYLNICSFKDRVSALKDYLDTDFFRKLPHSKKDVESYLENFILTVPEKASIKELNKYLNKHVNTSFENLLNLDINKIKQINKIKTSTRYCSNIHSYINDLKAVYKDEYYFDKMYYIEKITGKQFSFKYILIWKALKEFRIFYLISHGRAAEVIQAIAINANLNGIKDPQSFIEYIMKNTKSEIDKQAAQKIRIQEANDQTHIEHPYLFILGDRLYQYYCSELNDLYKYA